MPYLIKGNAQQIFHAFEQDWAITEGKNDFKTIYLDLGRTDFIGNEEQALKHITIWRENALGSYYLQGNISAGNLGFLLGSDPLKQLNEEPEAYHANFVRLHFAYLSDAGEPCGLMLMFRKDNPKQWTMGLIKKGYLAPQERDIVFLSNFDLDSFIKVVDTQEVSVSSTSFDNSLLQQTGSSLISSLLQEAMNQHNGDINLRFQRIKFLTRKLQLDEKKETLFNPICFKELNLSALFKDNLALDLLVQYKITDDFHLSFAMLTDLLLETSQLRKEFEALTLSNDEKINKSLLKLLILFYEKGLLEKNRHLLKDLNLIKTLSGFMWDEKQILLIPFLIQKKYTQELMQLILSESSYYEAIGILVELEPALTQDVPEFFQDPKKRSELKFIHALDETDCKILCLIFWVKGALSEDGYQEIITATQKYPLLAPTLVALDQTKTIDIEELRKIALNPQRHLIESITYHFEELKTFKNTPWNLHQLDLSELEAANSSLLLLRKSGIKDSKFYHLVLEKEKKGQALRLFLPQLHQIDNKNQRNVLIEILYAAIIHGIQTQGNKILAIQDFEQLNLAKNLRERFICVNQMQGLGFKKDIIDLVAQDTEEAKRFRQVILRVEEQCKIVYERLASSQSYRSMFLEWQKEEESYRKKLYQIAYDGLLNPNSNSQIKLQQVQNHILHVVDPHFKSDLYKALVVITNIIITILTFGLANAIKYKNTGNCWFFNHTRSWEELRSLNGEIVSLIDAEREEDILVESLIF